MTSWWNTGVVYIENVNDIECCNDMDLMSLCLLKEDVHLIILSPSNSVNVA